MPEKKPTKEKQYENLGRMVTNIYETGYLNTNQLLKMSFLKGVVSGVGGVVGATLVVALLLWGLSQFEDVPLIGPVVENIQNTIDQSD
jgi:Fe2+ transport system protein B